MNLYSIYTCKKDYSPIIIKQGFSIWALIFNFFWALYHRMWFVTLVVFLGGLIVTRFSELVIMERVVLFFVFGFFASEMREFYAQKAGCRLDDIIFAASEEEAEIKYMSRKEANSIGQKAF